jgi:hypothetical protein
MKVARPFIAWEIRQQRIRPVGYGLTCVIRFVYTPGSKDVMLAKSYRSLRDGIFMDTFQAINCLATFNVSLRDQIP